MTGISLAKELNPSGTFYGHGINCDYSSINTGDGNDTIRGNGPDIGIYTSYSTLNTGQDNDIITGTGSLLGIENTYSTIDTGDGNDIITGVGTNAIGIYNLLSSSINTGHGNDTITGTSSQGNGIENVHSTIDTGDGNDIITGIGINYGLYNAGTINTGNGNDSIIADRAFDSIRPWYNIYNSVRIQVSTWGIKDGVCTAGLTLALIACSKNSMTERL
jgi:hypothetical protein